MRFDRPGIVRVFCDIHSHMSAFILVFAHRYFRGRRQRGAYRIDNVPPGTYTLVAWNEGARSNRGAWSCRTQGARSKWISRSPMKLFSSLTNRIFLASALLAVVAIGVAVYLVNVAVTREAEASCERGSTRPAAGRTVPRRRSRALRS